MFLESFDFAFRGDFFFPNSDFSCEQNTDGCDATGPTNHRSSPLPIPSSSVIQNPEVLIESKLPLIPFLAFIRRSLAKRREEDEASED
jgi:hypothetical protein